MEIKRTTSTNSVIYDDAVAIRLAVFVQEQGVPQKLELDGNDAIATHYVGYVDEQPVVTLRTTPSDDRLHIQRVATVKTARHHGYAAELMTAVIDQARATAEYSIAYLGAQLHAKTFYAGLGFKAQGATFMEAGIEHQEMAIALK